MRPDGYGRWREHEREVDFFLEYDQGTEPLERVAAKLAGYHKLALATKIATPVVFWLPTSGREAGVRQALTAAGRWETGVRLVVATPHGPQERLCHGHRCGGLAGIRWRTRPRRPGHGASRAGP